MPTFVCTPRGFVFEVHPYTESVEYWDTPDGTPTVERSEYAMTTEFPPRIRRHVSTLERLEAPNIHIARIDFGYIRARREVLSNVYRWFKDAYRDAHQLRWRADRLAERQRRYAPKT